jgi:hypothetical protein
VTGRPRALAALLVLTAAPTPAAAEISDRPEIIATDVVSDAAIGSVFLEDLSNSTDGALFVLGLAGAALGGPTVHAAHGDWGRAGISLGGRLTLPIAGMLIGDAVCTPDAEDRFLRCFGHDLIGGAIGLAAAQVLDAALLARGPTDDGMPAAHIVSIGARF